MRMYKRRRTAGVFTRARNKTAARQSRRRSAAHQKRRTITNISRSVKPAGNFGTTKRVKLKYVENIQLNPGSAGNSATYVFRCNNVRDPNYTSTGHQPMFFDNYQALYGNVRVVKSYIKVTVVDNHVVNTLSTDATLGTTTGVTQYNLNSLATRLFIIRDKEVADYDPSIDLMIEE